jgi:PAS domain-containing protein
MMSDERYSALVASIYRAAVEPSTWASTLTEIAEASGSSGCVLMHSDRYGNAIADRSVGIDAARMRAYDEYYGALDPIPAALERLPVGTLIARDDVIAPDLLVHTEFFNDWVRPSGYTDTTFAVLGRDHDGTSWLTAVRPPSGDDLSECAALVDGLSPHLRQALETQSRIATLEGQNRDFGASMDSAADGLVIVGRDGVVNRANPAAERMLSAGDGLTMGGAMSPRRSTGPSTVIRRQATACRCAGPRVRGPISSGSSR